MANPKLEALVTRFVSDLEEVFRTHALTLVRESLGGAIAAPAAAGRATGRPLRAPAPRRPAAKARAAQPKKQKAKASSGARIRRTTAEIEQAAHRIFEHIRRNPGQRSEEIRAALKLSKKEWVTTIPRLADNGQVKRQGHKRTTTFTAA